MDKLLSSDTTLFGVCAGQNITAKDPLRASCLPIQALLLILAGNKGCKLAEMRIGENLFSIISHLFLMSIDLALNFSI
jgi:hypothetical protein